MYWIYATFMPSLETYGIALIITALTTFLLLRHHAFYGPGGRGRTVLHSTLPLATIKPALIHNRRPERLAAHLVNSTLRQTGQTSGVMALHWHVDQLMQTVKQVALVFFIFLCVTATMQSVIFANQQLEAWLTLQRGVTPTQDLPSILYDTANAPSGAAAATPGARTSVLVNVDVNVAGHLTPVSAAVESTPPVAAVPVVDGAPATAALVPVVAADVLLQQPTPTAIQLASASLEQLPQEAEPALLRTTANVAPVAPLERQVRTKLSQPPSAASASVTATVDTAPATPTLSPLALLPIAPTPTNTTLPTATAIPSSTPTLTQPTPTATALQPTKPPLTVLPAATATIATPTDTTPTTAPVSDSVTLLAPPEQTSSSDLITFAWQGQTPLPTSQAYEVIVWRPGQTPLTEGLGIAQPGQAASLTVQLRGLHEAGIIQPGLYHWGVLLVTVEPYTRLALLSPERTFYFDGPDQAPHCNPDRETC